MYILIYLSLAHSFNIEFLSHGSKDMYPVSKETGNIINQVIGREMRSKPPDRSKFITATSYLRWKSFVIRQRFILDMRLEHRSLSCVGFQV